MRKLADTGASSVVLSEADAKNIDIDTDSRDYTMAVSTANGEARSARITISEIRIGSIVRHDVNAPATRTMECSLLGMSFFRTLSRFEMRGDILDLVD